MKIFRQLFCKHKYKLYSDTKVSPSVPGYKYICPKCCKEIVLSSSNLINEINELKEDIRKENFSW